MKKPNMWKRLNFKWDKRTAFNILKFPFIITIRIPVVIIYWGIEWLADNWDVVNDHLPAWD